MAKENKSLHIRDLAPAARCFNGRLSNRDEYFNLLANTVSIQKRNGEKFPFCLQRFIKDRLIDGGAIGYYKVTGGWYDVAGQGINELGNPTQLTMYTANGRKFMRPASYDENPDGAYIIYSFPQGNVTFGEIIDKSCNFMAECDIAIIQNLEACKTPYVIVCKNKDLLLSYKQAVAQKQSGQAVLIVNEELGDGLKAVNISAEYLVDKFTEARDRAEDKLLNKLGIVTSNENKKERVQSAEVNATMNVASDYVYMMIDTFNSQMDAYGIDAQMVFNGSMEEFYLKDDETNETAVNDAENNKNIEVEQ